MSDKAEFRSTEGQIFISLLYYYYYYHHHHHYYYYYYYYYVTAITQIVRILYVILSVTTTITIGISVPVATDASCTGISPSH
jgi:hypothetical protein